ncbi:hypothetical protein M8818_003410 [Zalaria obscura]|uniref:Uncharacterized protein n=1 Tax=Zalaria obscura TaxID=2024903 RepID=A0ACC3SJH2_9PEZI
MRFSDGKWDCAGLMLWREVAFDDKSWNDGGNDEMAEKSLQRGAGMLQVVSDARRQLGVGGGHATKRPFLAGGLRVFFPIRLGRPDLTGRGASQERWTIARPRPEGTQSGPSASCRHGALTTLVMLACNIVPHSIRSLIRIRQSLAPTFAKHIVPFVTASHPAEHLWASGYTPSTRSRLMDASLGSLAFSSIIGPETLCLMGARAAHITPTICPGGELYYQGNASKHRTISRATVLSSKSAHEPAVLSARPYGPSPMKHNGLAGVNSGTTAVCPWHQSPEKTKSMGSFAAGETTAQSKNFRTRLETWLPGCLVTGKPDVQEPSDKLQTALLILV